MKRQAPKKGYDFGNKRAYRRSIWKTAKEFFHGQVADKKILIMPSIEGDEIEVAMNKGFRQNNIIICDKNPAIVATLKRKYPLVKCYGVELSRAMGRMKKEGIRLDAINADLCGPISAPLIKTLKSISESNVINNEGLLFLTILKGREQKNFYLKERFISLIHEFPEYAHFGLNFARGLDIKWGLYKFGLFAKILRFEEYKSCSGQKMIWFCMSVSKDIMIKDLKEWHVEEFDAKNRLSIMEKEFAELKYKRDKLTNSDMRAIL